MAGDLDFLRALARFADTYVCMICCQPNRVEGYLFVPYMGIDPNPNQPLSLTLQRNSNSVCALLQPVKLKPDIIATKIYRQLLAARLQCC